MKKVIYTLMFATVLTGCSKWTEPETNTEEFEKAALKELKENRDSAKWVAEAERTAENIKAQDVYWAQLTEYKKRTWLNTGEAGGQEPITYFWFEGGTWRTEKGNPRTWLQAVPDSVTVVSIWGGADLQPKMLSANQKKDIEIFHKKGSAILLCWQTPSVGLNLPAIDGKKGYQAFRERYPFAQNYDKWPELYARDLARYIIALNFDGYDIDWEYGVGDHGKNHRDRATGQDVIVYATAEAEQEAITLMLPSTDSDPSYSRFQTNPKNYVPEGDPRAYENVGKFVKEIAKYFGPVGANQLVKTEAERQANLRALFDASTAGFLPAEAKYINEFKPILPANYATKRYYLCCDVVNKGVGIPPVFRTGEMEKYFDKHFMQNYRSNDENPSDGWNVPVMNDLGGKYYNSTSANYQEGGFIRMTAKAEVVRQGRVWGLGAYHGQSDYGNTSENNVRFKNYLKDNNIKRNYLNYAWTREAIRIANPRPNYSLYKENPPIIILP